jgi:TolB-like protein
MPPALLSSPAHTASGLAASVRADGFAPADVRQALAQLLASKEFCKAQRTSRLIRFLIEKELAGEVNETGEYAIGVEVFDRDPLAYSTAEDPIVRVQVGRLRDRLKAYYATSGAKAELRFSIPIGSYMPIISRHDGAESQYPRAHLLGVAPLTNFIVDDRGVAFVQGLNEELSHQLFKAFGQKIVSHTFAPPHAAPMAWVPARTAVSHVLEGSVRANGDLVRTSVRLVDAAAGCIAWSEQFDRRIPFSIDLQEELAVAVCSALKLYFEQG